MQQTGTILNNLLEGHPIIIPLLLKAGVQSLSTIL